MIMQIATGTGENRSLEKVRFAQIINGAFVYENGESVSTVYPGLYHTAIDMCVYTYRAT